MSRTIHPWGQAKRFNKHKRKDKEWTHDSVWKPAERRWIDENTRRSKRTRLK